MTFGISLRELAGVGEHVADNASRARRPIKLPERSGGASGCVFAFDRVPPLDLVRSDRRIIDHDRAAGGQPLPHPIPIVERLDPGPPALYLNAGGSAALIAGCYENPVCE